MLNKGQAVQVKQKLEWTRKNYPAANWLQHPTIVYLMEDAPFDNTLDVLEVMLLNGKTETIYDFNIVKPVTIMFDKE